MKARTQVQRDFNNAVTQFRELIGASTPKAVSPSTRHSATEHIAVMSDLHVPDHDEQKLAAAIADAHERGVTHLVIGGDLMDNYSFSRYEQRQVHPAQLELQQTTAILRVLAEEFERVTIVSGNHDDRCKKWFVKRLPPEALWLVQFDLLILAAAGLSNVEFGSVELAGQTCKWMTQIGDAVIGHAEVSSGVLAKAPDRFADWALKWERRGFLKPFRVLVNGHTHQLIGPVIRADGIAVFESGCLTKIPEYAVDPGLRYRPQQTGYVYLEQRNGVTDLNASRVVVL